MWETDFYMVETVNQLMKCLLCCEVMKTAKVDNAKKCYPYANLEGGLEECLCENLRRNYRQQTYLITTFVKTMNALSETSYTRVAYRLGFAGKPFSAQYHEKSTGKRFAYCKSASVTQMGRE